MYEVIVIALFAAYSFIFYGIHRIDKRETKQDEWLAKLNEKGYAVAVCYGCKKAQDKILKYLNLGE